MKKENKGITLIALVVTIVVLLVLASIATYSGVKIIKQTKLNKFTTEMQTMQTRVNALYDSYTNNISVSVNGVEYIGKGSAEKPGIQEIGKNPEDILDESQLNKIFSNEGSGITDRKGYMYYDRETIDGLEIEGIEGEYLVNIEKRSVINSEGMEYEGVTYYTLDQLPNGLYNVEYANENTGKPTFETSVEEIGENKWRITISNIQYGGYIDKWEVKYRRAANAYWSTSEDLSFVVSQEGIYKVFLQNGDITSDIKDLNVGKSIATVTAQVTSTTYNDTDREIKEKITQVGNSLELDYSKCRWVYNTESNEIGTDESKYTGGNFSKQEEEITLRPSEPGEHYLHILTVDTSGNKTETIIKPVVIRINSVYDGGIAAPGRQVSIETGNGDLVTLSDGTNIITAGDDGKGYILFNKIDEIDKYNVITMNTIGTGEDENITYKTEIDLSTDSISIPKIADSKNYYSYSIDDYGVIQITIMVKETT